MLLKLENKEPGRKCVVWKLDISEAYQLIPMHPFWQIKQINSINGEFYVDRCNTFGGCASGSIFIAFNSLVAWIAKNIKGLKYIVNYVDDHQDVDLLMNWNTTHLMKTSIPKTKSFFFDCGMS